MQTKTTKGFTIIEGLIIILLIAALGSAGWFVWQSNQKDQTNESPKRNTTKQSKPDTNTKPQTDPSEGGKYLVIKEWGVRIPLPESLQGDISYGLRTIESDNSETASFEIGQLARLPDSNCRLHEEQDGSGKSGGNGMMLARKQSDLPPPEGFGNYIFISSDKQYSFYASRLKAPCASDEQIQIDLGDDLYSSLEQYTASSKMRHKQA